VNGNEGSCAPRPRVQGRAGAAEMRCISTTRTPYTCIHYGQYMPAPAVEVCVHFPNPIFCSHHYYYGTLRRRGVSMWSPVRHTLACLKFTSRRRCHRVPRPTRLFYDSYLTVWETDVIISGYSAAAALPCSCHLCVCEFKFPVSSPIDSHPSVTREFSVSFCHH
jgi:hypothetical protein